MRALAVMLGLLIAGCGASEAAGRLKAAEGRRCEATVAPMAVETGAPRLEWRLEAEDAAVRGVSQSAYRVLVASSRKMLDRGQGDMWDSGRVESGDSFGVVYRGKALDAEKAYVAGSDAERAQRCADGDADAEGSAELWVAVGGRSYGTDGGMGCQSEEQPGPLYAGRRGGVALSRTGRD
jgi:hypothetical protein